MAESGPEIYAHITEDPTDIEQAKKDFQIELKPAFIPASGIPGCISTPHAKT